MKECHITYTDGTQETFKGYHEVSTMIVGQVTVLRFIYDYEQITSINQNSSMPTKFDDVIMRNVKRFAFDHKSE